MRQGLEGWKVEAWGLFEPHLTDCTLRYATCYISSLRKKEMTVPSKSYPYHASCFL